MLVRMGSEPGECQLEYHKVSMGLSYANSSIIHSSNDKGQKCKPKLRSIALWIIPSLQLGLGIQRWHIGKRIFHGGLVVDSRLAETLA